MKGKGFGWTSDEWKTKIRFRWTSEEGKLRNQDSFWVDFRRRKTKKPKFVSGGLLKKENQEIKIPSSGGLPKNENPKIRTTQRFLVRVGFQRTKTQRFLVQVVFQRTEKPKDSRLGGLLTFRKRGTKIRLGVLGCLPKNGKNQRFITIFFVN
ncbi:hypothetical protein RhiirB3_454053 [Rhizophagus irregularis]|nr:hypothetical protein RhiirB3_454053 [Rhizophagus irregularis]